MAEHETIEGRVSVHPRGFGFLTGEDRTAFVIPPELNGFLEGDLVSAIVAEGEPGRWNASSLQLLQRSRRELFGSVVRRGKRTFLKVDRLVSNTDWLLQGEVRNLAEGQWLVARIEGQHAVALRVVEEDADLGLERCVVRHGIRAHFPDELEEQANALAARALPSGRRDLRQIPTVTIDAPSTTDIDDALSALPAEPDGSLRVLVSIADVDAWVPEGCDLDLEARERGTSVYLAGRILPMLPHRLSSESISLLPDQDRLALTAELRIGPEGEIHSVDVYESLMRSHARLSYEAVSDFLVHQESQAIPEEVQGTLRRLRTASARLSTVRSARGGVELGREEAYISFDPATREPSDLQPRGETMAHRLVERLMVAANEAIAGWLVARGLPAMYRVHPEPGSEQVEMLAQSAANFGLEPAFGPRLTPRGLAAFEQQYRDTPFAPALRTVLGWALGPARYTVDPGMHFGLGAPLYLHFTSPIRRYADLVVHRIVKGYLAGERGLRPGDAGLAELAEHLNRVTYRAGKAENERHRMLVARYFTQRVGEVLEGNIVSVKPFGLVVQMLGTGATGTLATEVLPDGPYEIEEAGQALVGRYDRFAVGDFVEVVVAGANEELGRVELHLS